MGWSGDGERNRLYSGGFFPHLFRRQPLPDGLDTLHIFCRREWVLQLLLRMTAQYREELLIELYSAHGDEDMQPGIYQIEVDGRVFHFIEYWQLFWFQQMQCQWGVTPAGAEDAIHLIEEKQNAVFFVEGQFHLTGAEGFGGDDIGFAELQDEHGAIGVDLKHTTVPGSLDGQGELLSYLKVYIVQGNTS